MTTEINKITESIEKLGFDLSSNTKQGNDYVIEFSQYTPLGEDWSACLFYDGSYDDFKNKVSEYCDGFDVDEETEPWIESRGQNGTPTSIKALVEDAEWKQEQLEELSESL